MRVSDLDGHEVHSKVKGATLELASVWRAGPCGGSVAQSAGGVGRTRDAVSFAQIGVVPGRDGERVKSDPKRAFLPSAGTEGMRQVRS